MAFLPDNLYNTPTTNLLKKKIRLIVWGGGEFEPHDPPSCEHVHAGLDFHDRGDKKKSY